MNVNRNDRGFGYIEFVAGSHDHVKTRVWVHNDLIQEKDGREYVEFPIRGGWITKTEKGSLVLKKWPQDAVVFHIEIPSGYRGSARIDRIAHGPGTGELVVVATGSAYHSGQGSLGDTAWALVNSDGPIEVFGTASGRRIDNPAVAFRLTPDGEREELINAPDVCGLLD